MRFNFGGNLLFRRIPLYFLDRVWFNDFRHLGRLSIVIYLVLYFRYVLIFIFPEFEFKQGDVMLFLTLVFSLFNKGVEKFFSALFYSFFL